MNWISKQANVYSLRSIALVFFIIYVNLSLAEPQLESAASPTITAETQQLVNLLRQTVNDATSFSDRYDAEVWLMSKTAPLSRFVSSESQQFSLLSKIHAEANRAKLSPEIVLALIEIESGFNRYAVSSAGAQGMMQIMPFWKNEIGRSDDNLIQTDVNLRYGCTILKFYLDKEEGRIADALARYNGSYGSYKYSEKVLNAWAKYWR
jgi:soluble lytic murein transglycosylase-like protein